MTDSEARKLIKTDKQIEGSEVFTLDSRKVDEQYTIRVFLPYSYEDEGKSFPVMYLFDSDRSFGMAETSLSYLNLGLNFGMGKNVPEMIIVGIGYERGLIPWLFTRVRDFTPSEDSSFNYNNPNFQIPESGKADDFLEFLRDELIPLIENTYRVDPSLKIAASHSMSGLFCLYSVISYPGLFQKAIIGSPFVGWDNKYLFNCEEEFSKTHDALPLKAYFSVTGGEPTPDYIEEVRDFVKTLKGRNYKSLEVELCDYPEENHFSSWPKVFSDGLIYLFNS